MSVRFSRSEAKRPADPDAARAEALRQIARRPLTEAELRDRLEAKGYSAGAIEEAVERLHDEGLIDDRGLAIDYILARATRLGHGRSRLVRELERRGVHGTHGGDGGPPPQAPRAPAAPIAQSAGPPRLRSSR